MSDETKARTKKSLALGGILTMLIGGYAEISGIKASIKTLEEVSGPQKVIERMEKIDQKLTDLRDRLIRIEAQEESRHAPARRSR